MNVSRIPIELLAEDHATRWLGRELGATTVVSGEFNFKPGGPEVKFKIFDSRPKEKKIESFSTKLPELTFEAEDLQPMEPYSKLDKVIKNYDGGVIPTAGKEGVTVPKCTFTPNPSYTDPAREAKFSGYLTLEAIVTPQGTVEVQRIVRGLPVNLNEQSRRMLETWRCNPATKDGSPVSALVVFEVNFRLY